MCGGKDGWVRACTYNNPTPSLGLPPWHGRGRSVKAHTRIFLARAKASAPSRLFHRREYQVIGWLYGSFQPSDAATWMSAWEEWCSCLVRQTGIQHRQDGVWCNSIFLLQSYRDCVPAQPGLSRDDVHPQYVPTLTGYQGTCGADRLIRNGTLKSHSLNTSHDRP